MPEFIAGAVFNGKYLIEAFIGSTDDARVYQARMIFKCFVPWGPLHHPMSTRKTGSADPGDPIGFVNIGRPEEKDLAFVVELQPGVLSPTPPTFDSIDDYRRADQQYKQRIGEAMRIVSPAIAGFAEWERVNPSDVKVFDKDWEAKPPWATCIVSSYRRRLSAAKSKARYPYEFTSQEKRLLLAATNGQCQLCGSTNALEYDHVVPVSLGGIGSIDNAQLLCNICHNQKTQRESSAFGSWRRAVFITGTSRPHDVRPALDRGIVTEALRSNAGPYYLWMFVNQAELSRLRKSDTSPQRGPYPAPDWLRNLGYAMVGWGPLDSFADARRLFEVLFPEHIEASPNA